MSESGGRTAGADPFGYTDYLPLCTEDEGKETSDRHSGCILFSFRFLRIWIYHNERARGHYLSDAGSGIFVYLRNSFNHLQLATKEQKRNEPFAADNLICSDGRLFYFYFLRFKFIKREKNGVNYSIFTSFVN